MAGKAEHEGPVEINPGIGVGYGFFKGFFGIAFERWFARAFIFSVKLPSTEILYQHEL